MARVRVHNFSISIDGYGAGPRQAREEPLGVGGEALHEWLFPTRTFQRMGGKSGGTTGVDDEFAGRFGDGVGAWIMGRNMFGPIRGGWPDDTWRGWWGKNPPYHGPVFVLTHHARPSVEMEGGTVYHFVTKGIREAMESAVAAAEGKDVQISGGVSTVRHLRGKTHRRATRRDRTQAARLRRASHVRPRSHGLGLCVHGVCPDRRRNSCRADETSMTRGPAQSYSLVSLAHETA